MCALIASDEGKPKLDENKRNQGTYNHGLYLKISFDQHNLHNYFDCIIKGRPLQCNCLYKVQRVNNKPYTNVQ